MLSKYHYSNALSFIATASRHAPVPKALEQLVLEKADEILKKNQEGIYALNKGRKDLLTLMHQEPLQLTKDIARATRIIIGSNNIRPHLKNKNPEIQYSYFAKSLEKYVNSKNAGYIGKFYTIEIVYAVVQSFLAPAQSKAYKNCAILKEPGEWGAEIGNSEIIKTFRLMPDDKNILIASNISKKILTNINAPEKRKEFITKANLIFDLQTGELKYNYEYALDGMTKEWTLSTFRAI